MGPRASRSKTAQVPRHLGRSTGFLVARGRIELPTRGFSVPFRGSTTRLATRNHQRNQALGAHSSALDRTRFPMAVSETASETLPWAQCSAAFCRGALRAVVSAQPRVQPLAQRAALQGSRRTCGVQPRAGSKEKATGLMPGRESSQLRLVRALALNATPPGVRCRKSASETDQPAQTNCV